MTPQALRRLKHEALLCLLPQQGSGALLTGWQKLDLLGAYRPDAKAVVLACRSPRVPESVRAVACS